MPGTTSRPRTSDRRPTGDRRPSGPRRSGAPGDARYGSESRYYRSGGGSSRRTAQPAGPATELERALDAAAAAPEPGPVSFAALGLPEALVTVLARRGMHEPFAIQRRATPDALAGRDVLGRARTGSGKTLAFGLPLLARLVRGEGDAPRQPGRPRGLVLAPTRELAAQVTASLAPLGHALDLRVQAVFGGAPIGRQIDAARRGVDVVVATPGRLGDLIERGAVTLADVEVTVLDEADYMADLGFLPVVTELLEQTRPGGQRMLFSATLDRGVDRLVEKFLVDPALHALPEAAPEALHREHRTFTTTWSDKPVVAAEIAGRPARTLFFVRTKAGTDTLAEQLRAAGVDAAAIHGDLPQGARRRALEAFTTGRTRVLVATDVAARGLHVDDLDLVVHYDPAGDHKDFLHRSGRTARAGASGLVVSLALPAQQRAVARLHQQAGLDVPAPERVFPGDDTVTAVATSGEPVVVTAPAPRERADRPRRSGGSGGRPWRPRGDGPRRAPRERPARSAG